MFLAEPPPTAYDFRFQLLGFPIRVTPFFWVASVLFGWEWASFWHERSQVTSEPMNQGVLLLMWIAAVFLSILIHEMGHGIAMRYYGIPSSLVLYHFGGLAIPDNYGSFMGMGHRASRRPNQIVISAAGPAAQLLLATVVAVPLLMAGYIVPVPFLEAFLMKQLPLEPLPSLPIHLIVDAIMYPSVYWALLNLMPVYPLDGGQIAREIALMFNPADGVRISLILSVVTGVGLAIYAFMNGQTFMAILFAMLAYSSYQVLQAYSGRGGGFGGGKW